MRTPFFLFCQKQCIDNGDWGLCPKHNSKDVTQATKMMRNFNNRLSFGRWMYPRVLSTQRCITPERQPCFKKQVPLYKYVADKSQSVDIAYMWFIKDVSFRNCAYIGAFRKGDYRLQFFDSVCHFVDGIGFRCS